MFEFSEEIRNGNVFGLPKIGLNDEHDDAIEIILGWASGQRKDPAADITGDAASKYVTINVSVKHQQNVL